MADLDGLVIRPFRLDDVDNWTRTPLHREHVLGGLEAAGDYLAAVLPDGRIAGKIGIRYDEHPGAGNLFQFDVVEHLRNKGIGTALIDRAEQVVRDHGCDRATLGVEDSNAGAIRLYRRRGYQVIATEFDEWDQDAPDGTVYRYRCRCLVMQCMLSKQ